MQIAPILADAGRPSGAALNLLNAGWTFTTGIPLPDGGFHLPAQALAVFIEASWSELNRPQRMVVECVDDEGRRAGLFTGDGFEDARIEQEIVVPPVPNAPNGTPGYTTALLEFPFGTLRVEATRRRYVWHVRVGETDAEVGFWVNAPATAPSIGGGAAAAGA